jgi:CPA2 family monovalent cation:H+ antiporter-2
VVSLRRASGAVLQPHESNALAPGDTLVLSGSPETLARAEAMLLAPG